MKLPDQLGSAASICASVSPDRLAEREVASEVGDVRLWVCIGKCSVRRFMVDIPGRLVFLNADASDAHRYLARGYEPIAQISIDCFDAYLEGGDLAFEPYVNFGIRRTHATISPASLTFCLARPLHRLYALALSHPGVEGRSFCANLNRG